MANAFLIESAVRDLARTIADEGVFDAPRDDGEIVRQLLLSILSSRVRWERACEVVDSLIATVWSPGLAASLTGDKWPVRVLASLASHRHPHRAEQLLAGLLGGEARPLQNVLNILQSNNTAKEARRLLIKEVPGLGPKQSSLFLRNLGRGKRLAVLDRHVLRFMYITGLTDKVYLVPTIGRYEQIECKLLAYADYRRTPADALDLAIWIVMRIAREG